MSSLQSPEEEPRSDLHTSSITAPATSLVTSVLDLSADSLRYPSVDGRPFKGHVDHPSSRPADLPSPFLSPVEPTVVPPKCAAAHHHTRPAHHTPRPSAPTSRSSLYSASACPSTCSPSQTAAASHAYGLTFTDTSALSCTLHAHAPTITFAHTPRVTHAPAHHSALALSCAYTPTISCAPTLAHSPALSPAPALSYAPAPSP
ncbi:uncharacterized protein [Palaemon carinicauda]|uniref:uncharacterized protein n=1 Tax=Palaemon carinicauda TaxID=392227 RepID=UPI0035B63238